MIRGKAKNKGWSSATYRYRATVHKRRGDAQAADVLAVGVFAAIVVATAITWAIAWRRWVPERRV